MKRGRAISNVFPGRVRIFHGVNAVNKGFPWYWTDFLENPQHIQDLQDWGASHPSIVVGFSKPGGHVSTLALQELTL
jgi:hypothetical protein